LSPIPARTAATGRGGPDHVTLTRQPCRTGSHSWENFATRADHDPSGAPPASVPRRQSTSAGHQLRLRAARKHYQPIRDSGNNLRAHHAKHTAAQHDSLILDIMVNQVRESKPRGGVLPARSRVTTWRSVAPAWAVVASRPASRETKDEARFRREGTPFHRTINTSQ
jgi:hypothetical protein